jgi:ribosomal protein L37AE/L43A
MAMAKKATLVCRPCGTRVMVSDLGAAVVECYECGVELVPAAKAPKKVAAAKPRKKLAAKKAPARKPVAKKTAPKKKK